MFGFNPLITALWLPQGIRKGIVRYFLRRRLHSGESNLPADLRRETPGLYNAAVSLGIPLPSLVVGIIDGWGMDGSDNQSENPFNAFAVANTPVLDGLWKDPHHLTTKLHPTGPNLRAVVSDHQGSTDIGHPLVGTSNQGITAQGAILGSIAAKTFEKNPAYVEAIKRVKQRQESGEKDASLFIGGLLSDKGVHHYDRQFHELLRLAKAAGLKDNVYVHAFADGRDTYGWESVVDYLDRLQEVIGEVGVGQVALVAGRVYLERSGDYGPTRKLYDVLVNGKPIVNEKVPVASAVAEPGNLREKLVEIRDALKAIGRNEQFFPSIGVLGTDGKPITVRRGDTFIWSDFRPDRSRQLIQALVADRRNPALHQVKDPAALRDNFLKNFGDVPLLEDLHVVATWPYYPEMPDTVPVAFHNAKVQHNLYSELAEKGYRILAITESQKESYLIDAVQGYDGKVYEHVEKLIFPSYKPEEIREHPGCRSSEIADGVGQKMGAAEYDILLFNIPPPDLVSHELEDEVSFQNAIKAIEATDRAVGQVLEGLRRAGG
jgi:2,3-bisphosphoglycerate-independent phosphoglycerate mutase